MSGKLPFFSRERSAVGHPGACQFKLLTVHVFPLGRCKGKVCMRSTDKAYMGLICSQLKGHMHGWNLSCCLKHITVSLVSGKLHSCFHVVLFCGVYHLVCPKAFCQLQTLITDIKNHNLFGTEDLCPLHGKHSDGSAAKDRHALASLIIILQKSVKGYCGRLEHCALLIGNGCVKRNCVLLRNHHIICIASLLSGADKAVMLAKGIIAFLAVLTFHAGYKRSS